MTSHTNHDHPATAAARRACREARDNMTHDDFAAEAAAMVKKLGVTPRFIKPSKKYSTESTLFKKPHCTGCGSTDLDDVSAAVCDQGYSACCNEPVEYR